MLAATRLSTFIALTLVSIAFAAIGPITNLSIDNAVVAPDGFPRLYVVRPSSQLSANVVSELF
jgi:iron transport multicopper oxidase